MNARLSIPIAAVAAALARPVSADPVKVGPYTLTAAPCTIDGPKLVMGDAVGHAMAAAPDGSLIVLDGKGVLHRYKVRAGKTCALHAIDALALRPPADFPTAFVDVDGNGTIYARFARDTVRVDGKKVTPICGGEDAYFVSASPRAMRVWTWGALTSVFHEDVACVSGGRRMDLSPTRDDFMGTVYAIDDRAVLDASEHQYLIDGDGKRIAKLADPVLTLIGFAACGELVCGVTMSGLRVWRASGEQVGGFDFSLTSLVSADSVRGFAMIGGAAYVLGVDGDRTTITRLDGLPR